MVHARKLILDHMTNFSLKIPFFFPFCAVRGLSFTWLETSHTKLSEIYLARGGSVYIKVEKVISCLLLRPCTEDSRMMSRWVQHQGRGNSCLLFHCLLLGARRLVSWAPYVAVEVAGDGPGIEPKEEVCKKADMRCLSPCTDPWKKHSPRSAEPSCCRVESKMLALLIHLGKRFCCSRFLAASEHVLLKYLFKCRVAEGLGRGVCLWVRCSTGPTEVFSFGDTTTAHGSFFIF